MSAADRIAATHGALWREWLCGQIGVATRPGDGRIVERGEQGFGPARIRFAVGVGEEKEFAPRQPRAVVARRRGAGGRDGGADDARASSQRGGVVGGAVVHDDDLVSVARQGLRGQRVEAGRKGGRSVSHRDDNRDKRGLAADDDPSPSRTGG